MLEHPVAVNWWCARNQDWPYYLTVFQSNLTPDGLELWCVCVALGTHLMFIQRGQVWSTREHAPNVNDYAVMWLESGAVFCNVYTNNLDEEGQLQLQPPP